MKSHSQISFATVATLLIATGCQKSDAVAAGSQTPAPKGSIASAVGLSEDEANQLFGKPLNRIEMYGSANEKPRKTFQEVKYKTKSNVVFVMRFNDGVFQDAFISKAFKQADWKTAYKLAGFAVTADTKVDPKTGLITPTPELKPPYKAYWLDATDKTGGYILSIDSK